MNDFDEGFSVNKLSTKIQNNCCKHNKTENRRQDISDESHFFYHKPDIFDLICKKKKPDKQYQEEN